MEKNILDQFEKDFNVITRTMTEKDFLNIISTEKFQEYAKDDGLLLDLLTAISKVNQDPEISVTIFIISTEITLRISEYKIMEIFKSYTDKIIERETLIEKLSELMSDDNVITSLSAYLCFLVSLFDVDDFDKDTLKEDLVKFRTLYERLSEKLLYSYPLISDLWDLLFQVREEYFSRFQEDLFDEEMVNWMRKKLIELHEFEDSVSGGKIPEVDILPEELGLIDITKLKGERRD